MRRVVVALIVLVFAAGGSPALAQTGDGGGAFGPLPPPTQAPTPTPEPPPSVEAQKETDRTLLFAIGGVLLVLFVVIARFITSDARRTLRSQPGGAGEPQLREEGPHRHAKQTKAKARAKTKAQRAGRRHNR